MSQTRITTPFTAESTAAEVIAGIDLTGRRAVVTGGGSGIGLETVRALAAAGAETTLAVRTVAAARAVADDLTAGTTVRPVHVEQLDLSDQQSIGYFAARWEGPLHILVNNAGVMAIPELTRTSEGWEMHFATNHLGHFALANALRTNLAEAGNARMVAVSSVGHIDGDVDFDDLQFERRHYQMWAAYGQSKTANILFAVEAARRWATHGITANALNPGRIPSTNLMRHMGDAAATSAAANSSSIGVSFKSPEQGAATSVLLAGSPLLEGVTGRYFEDSNEAEQHQPGIRRGVMGYALDPDQATRLWDISDNLLALGTERI